MKPSPVYSAVLLLVLLSLACSLSAPGPGPQATPQATPTAIIPLAPALVETDPPPGSELALQGTLTFYFNQPMQKDVAFGGLPEGSFNWVDDGTLQYSPAQPFPAATDVDVTLSAAQAANGLHLQAPVSLHFRTADLLRLTQFLPTATHNVTATSAIVASFNQPVVALAADPATLPQAFTLAPSISGTGGWINTSTYAFHADPGLAGGVTYTATINNALTAASGAPLDAKAQAAWSFAVALPRIVSFEPAPDKPQPLDPTIKITFNGPMDHASVESGFSLVAGSGGVVDGKPGWEQNDTVFTFKPSGLLARGSTYNILLDATARSRGGTALTGGNLSAVFSTFPDFAVASTDPAQGGTKPLYNTAAITLSAPLPDQLDVTKFVSVTPDIPNLGVWSADDVININGLFDPATLYTVTVSQDLADRWGQALGRKFIFQFRTPAADPALNVPYFTGKTFVVRPDKPLLGTHATNISAVTLSSAPLPLGDYFKLSGAGGGDYQKTYQAAGLVTWHQGVVLKANRSETVQLGLTPNGSALATGVYYLWLQTPEGAGNQLSNPYFVIASNTNLTLKVGARDALVWAVDVRTQKALADAVVSLFDAHGNLITYGRTDANGLWYVSLQENSDPYQSYYATLGQPGDDDFGMAVSAWDDGVEPYSFGVGMDWQGTHTQVYMYSDRPIYRPGQTVFFRGLIRQAFNGRYSMSAMHQIALTLTDDQGKKEQDLTLPLSDFGTFNGQYNLPEGTKPGFYTLGNNDLQAYLSFTVADYHKPEINLGVAVTPQETRQGKPLQGRVSAQYFFGAPADDLPFHWSLFSTDNYFDLPGYNTGTWLYRWGADYGPGSRNGFYGRTIAEGNAVTGADGTALINLPGIGPGDAGRLTLEVTAQEEGSIPISARSSVVVHPENYYIGVRPAQWVGQAGSPMNFDVLTADWTRNLQPAVDVKVSFSQVDFGADQKPALTPVTASDLTTDASGKARITFTPAKAGTYLLDVSGGAADTQVLVWVGGAAQAAWPQLPEQHLQLVAEHDSYRPGDSAQIFIPNPFGVEAPALVTVERGIILRSQTLTLGPAGSSVAIPLDDDAAPNVYVSATVLGKGSDFRLGYLNLNVTPVKQTLNVELTSKPERSAPGGEVNFGVRVTDSQSRPISGEFSLAVIDEAVLALADPNSQDIVPAFYGVQNLGIRTGLSLAVYAQRYLPFAGGRGGGGGGGEAAPVVRENFPDTAYWNASILTDNNGRAQVQLKLPDNLTTWRVELRGLTQDTLVGQAVGQVVSTKDLLIRPVTPGFLVAGDHATLGATVNNNTTQDLQAAVTLQATGFNLDDPQAAVQNVKVPAHGHARVQWIGTVQVAPQADLTFSVSAGGLQDATRPNDGAIPILRYTAPQTFSTAGTLPDAGSRSEIVSLPRTFSPTGGELNVELSPSLAAMILGSLNELKRPEQTWNSADELSYFLPNLETYRTLQDAGLEAPELKARLDASLAQSVASLVAAQNSDGGWSWGAGGDSDAFISAYALFGLRRASQAGVDVPAAAIQKGRDYLQSARPYLGGNVEDWQLDRTAFYAYVFDQTGGVDAQIVEKLYSQRDHLNPWAQALLALTLESVSHGDPRGTELFSNLEGRAIRSATGAHWESRAAGQNPDTALFTTAIVSYMLAQRDPAAPVLADAVRYLALQRGASGGWGSSLETSWVIIALNAAMKGSGELQAAFPYDVTLNTVKMMEGKAAGPQALTPVTSSVPLTNLSLALPNSLVINRGAGTGKLYYRAALTVDRPVEGVQPLKAGLEIGRAYFDADCKAACPPLTSIALQPGRNVKARVTLVVPQSAYYLVLDDFIPAGSQVLDTTLKTTEQGEGSGTDVQANFDPADPFADGWGWWLFDQPRIYSDHVTWTASFLPAGTYELTYTLLPLQAGEYHVLPAHAWEYYFPEVQATSAGAVFQIKSGP